MNMQLLVLAMAPVPGRVKTRMCPPCTPQQAAEVAAASLADTLRCGQHTAAARRTIVLHGRYAPPAGWYTVAQHGEDMTERVVHAFTDTALPDIASLLIGADTPQITPAMLGSICLGLTDADAVLGPSESGGWWALALRDPYHVQALREVPMSTPDTGDRTVAALRQHGLRIRYAAALRDVDTAADARYVAARCRPGAFTEAVRAHVPSTVPVSADAW